MKKSNGIIIIRTTLGGNVEKLLRKPVSDNKLTNEIQDIEISKNFEPI